MNIFRNSTPAAILGVASLFLLPAAQGFGQTATTDPVGYLQVSCLANSDTLVSIPFARPAAFTGAVASVSGASSNVFSFKTAPNFTANAFVYNPSGTPAVTDNFYLIVGPATATLTGTITVTQNSATVTGSGTSFNTQLVAGDRITFSDGPNRLTYTVATTPTTASSLTLDRPFADTTATSTAGLAATFDHSPYEGRWYMVTANDTSTVTVDLAGDNVSALAVGTQVSIIPYWTISGIFPDSDAGKSFTPTVSTRSGYTTRIYIPTYASTSSSVPSGTTLSASTIYYYLKPAGSTTGTWYTTSDTVNNHGNDPLLPDGYFIVHNGGTATTLPLTFAGAVPTNKLAVPLISHASTNQDNAFGLTRPMPLTVGTLGLTISTTTGDGGAFKATSSTRSGLQDLLYLYDNGTPAYTKSASKIYYYSTASGNVGWRSTDAPTTDCSNDPIPAASALTVRKVAGVESVTEVVNNPNY